MMPKLYTILITSLLFGSIALANQKQIIFDGLYIPV
jgi:hypothetical protein